MSRNVISCLLSLLGSYRNLSRFNRRHREKAEYHLPKLAAVHAQAQRVRRAGQGHKLLVAVPQPPIELGEVLDRGDAAVALEELYAGARGRHRNAVEILENSFARAERLLVPDLEDWKQAGIVLSDLGARFGYEQIGRKRLSNDALLAVVAVRRSLTLLTANGRDFGRLSQIMPLDWRVVAG
jgi:predicted nucleic acid-binding protein